MSTTTFSVESLENYIDPASVAPKAVEIVDVSDETALEEVCRLHRFCLERISHENHEELRSANEVLETLRGDCTDQTVLLSSLLLSREIPVRIVHVQNHMFPEALLPVKPGGKTDREVHQLYSLGRETKVRALAEPNHGDENIPASGYWYPVDSEMSRYMGDLQVHAEEQLMVHENGEWQWEEVRLCKPFSPKGIQRRKETSDP